MPVAMILGSVFYSFFESLIFITPYLIFIMLFFAYCNLKLNQIRFTKMHLILVAIQLIASVTIFLIIKQFDLTVAQGVMICVLAPTATAAPVIAGMLKGNIASLTAYSLISNLSVAILAPVIFTFAGANQDLSFIDSFFRIVLNVIMHAVSNKIIIRMWI